VISREAGYRTFLIPKLALAINGFVNSYDDLRTQEPTPPVGIPIVLANKQAGRVSGLELGAHYEPRAAWQLWGGYAYLHERFEFDADRGSDRQQPEHNVRRTLWLRSLSTSPKNSISTRRSAGPALPRPVVPPTASSRFASRGFPSSSPVARTATACYTMASTVNPDPCTKCQSIFARLTWRSR
jgi:outer membrane receptor protein involved in Fe transport